jgi:acyl carrier protein
MNMQGTTNSAASLTNWLVDEIARRLEVPRDQVDADAEFDELGLDSVQAVALSGALSDKVGSELPATLLYEHRSIRSLANYLAKENEVAQ